MAWEYLPFTCDREELQAKLTEHGDAGWRLHTCEPYVIMGNAGIGTVHFVVVMDKLKPEKAPPAEPRKTAADGAPVVKRDPIGGLRMKG